TAVITAIIASLLVLPLTAQTRAPISTAAHASIQNPKSKIRNRIAFSLRPETGQNGQNGRNGSHAITPSSHHAITLSPPHPLTLSPAHPITPSLPNVSPPV